jgi:hypothetical protein
MKSFKQYLNEKSRCWTGYKPVPGKKAFSKDSCVKEDGMGAGAVGGAPTNNVGGGNIAGAGVGKSGEPGVNMKKKKSPIIISLTRRASPKL